MFLTHIRKTSNFVRYSIQRDMTKTMEANQFFHVTNASKENVLKRDSDKQLLSVYYRYPV